MPAMPVRVSILGAQEESFFCSSDLFTHAATSLGGLPVLEPPPFACPCSDGLLIIYTLKRSVSEGTTDIHGGYIFVPLEQLEKKDIGKHWAQAQKRTDSATMLRIMGFVETRPHLLN